METKQFLSYLEAYIKTQTGIESSWNREDDSYTHEGELYHEDDAHIAGERRQAAEDDAVCHLHPTRKRIGPRRNLSVQSDLLDVVSVQRHRQDGKPDAPAERRARMSGYSAGPDGLQMGPYDPHSVMNYCNPVFLNNGVLSELDKKAVRLLYGTL